MPVLSNFPHWPYFAPDEIEAVQQVLQFGKINYWTGEQCKLFEKEFAEFLGVKHAISLFNGTVALELALYALGIGPGDDVIVPSRTFIATASSVVARGARPVVADVDLVSQNVTAETLQAALTPNTKAIIVVHLAGWPCDMDSILNFAAQYNLKVIEDCAQAVGAKYKNRYIGSFGDMAAFSFCQDKIITTGGEGGLLVTNNHELWRRAWAYKDHGKNPDKAFVRESNSTFRWLHESFGSNFRMTEMQAAIGRIQLKKLPDWVAIRNRNAKILASYFENLPAIRITEPFAEIEHAYYKYYAFVEPQALKNTWDRDAILREIVTRGIPCGTGSCSEIYLEEAFVNHGISSTIRLPNAKQLGETSLMFMVHPTLDEACMHRMGDRVKQILQSL